jgi:hypothetical protein
MVNRNKSQLESATRDIEQGIPEVLRILQSKYIQIQIRNKTDGV